MRPERVGGVAPTVLMAGGGGGRSSLWRTPTPYLFLGFAVMMGLIVVALLVLICTRRKASSSAEDEKAASVRVLVPLDREPKVVVIMAGDALPSFIAVASAKPLPLAFTPPSGAEAV
ncbi:protein GLUTAMINE DUMPER 6-like [Miscanthus floridulus]|uniref:protein GLUTAMINE DUMPER 6-like n=1 Tax=Miscanthus floridulus TaxID=154761 RepID=UPI00345A5FBD